MSVQIARQRQQAKGGKVNGDLGVHGTASDGQNI